MSRKIDLSDPSKLTRDDIIYLQTRGQLPRGVKPVNLRAPEMGVLPDEDTGDVDTRKPDGGRVPPAPVTEDAGDEDGPGNTKLDEAEDYDEMSLAELREECKKRDLKANGSKAVLIERLEEDDEAKAAASSGSSDDDGSDDDEVIEE